MSISLIPKNRQNGKKKYVYKIKTNNIYGMTIYLEKNLYFMRGAYEKHIKQNP